MIRPAALQGIRDIAGKLGRVRITKIMSSPPDSGQLNGISGRGFRIDCRKHTIDQAAGQAGSEDLASCAADAERLQNFPTPCHPPAHNPPIISLGKVATRIFRFVRQSYKAQFALFLCFFGLCARVGHIGASDSCAPCASLHARATRFRGHQTDTSRALREHFADTSRTSFHAFKCFSCNAKEAYGKERRTHGEHFADTSRTLRGHAMEHRYMNNNIFLELKL